MFLSKPVHLARLESSTRGENAFYRSVESPLLREILSAALQKANFDHPVLIACKISQRTYITLEILLFPNTSRLCYHITEVLSTLFDGGARYTVTA
jgi:hypothetical protein